MSTFFLVLGYAFAGLGVAGFASAIVHILQSRETTNWPRALGEIQRSWIETKQGGEGEDMYEAHVEYRYIVEGRNFVSERVRIGAVWSSSSQRPANSLISRYPVGLSVVVAYDPDKPGHSVLEPGSTRNGWGLVAVSLAWIAVSLGFVLLVR